MKSRGTILVVDDETYVRESLSAILSRKGFEIRTADSVDAALEPAMLGGLDAVITDLKMKGRGGLELVREIVEREPHLPVVVLTAHATVTSAVECMQAGAYDYLVKPTDPSELTLVLDRALRQESSRRELEYLRRGGGQGAAQAGPVGASPAWKRILELVRVAAPVDTTVLVTGDSGTGKEEVARLIHSSGPRAAAPYVQVNCAAIPSELFESEFFGHRRGSFTGAISDREGRFRVAHKGTLLLDEINSLSIAAQAKVLRVIQEGEFERVGDSRPTKVDVRLICASNVDLEKEVEAGRFRADLFYRINVLTIPIPALRERREDIEVLAETFLAELAPRLGKPGVSISPTAKDSLLHYDWPGNVRELRNVIERGILLCRDDTIESRDLPFHSSPEPRSPTGETGLDLRSRLRETEKTILLEALTRAEGLRRQAAQWLGVDERNLSYYLRKHDLMDYEPSERASPPQSPEESRKGTSPKSK